jgi:hypothetical protein
MAGFLLNQGSTVLCTHGGQAQPTVTSSRVKAGGQPIVTQSSTYSIAGCSNMYGPVYCPCVTAQWTTAASRVKADGMPVLLQDSQAVSTPNGTGLTIAQTQTRVKGQ